MPLETADQEYQDIFVMLEDVHSHVRLTGRPVALDDNPLTRRLGYKDNLEGKSWQISLGKVKQSIDARPPVESTVRKLLSTAAGRLLLANQPLVA